jgi:hypothetical protein
MFSNVLCPNEAPTIAQLARGNPQVQPAESYDF